MKPYDFFKLAKIDSYKKVNESELGNYRSLMKTMIYDCRKGIVLIEFISTINQIFLKCTYRKGDQVFDVEEVYLLDYLSWANVLGHVTKAESCEDEYTFEVPVDGC